MENEKLRQWKCHKIVRAGEIVAVDQSNIGGDVVRHLMIKSAYGEPLTWSASAEHKIWARGLPAVGDFFVVYDDDYVSWSPAKAFIDGYAPLNESDRGLVLLERSTKALEAIADVIPRLRP